LKIDINNKILSTFSAGVLVFISIKPTKTIMYFFIITSHSKLIPESVTSK